MQLHPRVSSATIAFAAQFEGLRRHAARLPHGQGWTIGYGHVRTAREGARVTAEEARALLGWDLSQAAALIDATVFTPLEANAFDALCDFCFNIGEPAFRTSEVLRRLNENEPLRAAAGFEMWRRADLGGESYIIDSIVRRRAAEKALFLTPAAGFPAAPTSVLQPRLDRRLTYGTDRLAASEEACVDCLAPLEGEDCLPVVTGRTAVGQAADALTARLARIARDPAEPEGPAEVAPPPLAQGEEVLGASAEMRSAGEGPPAHDARIAFPPPSRRGAPAGVRRWLEAGAMWAAIGLIGLVLFGAAMVCVFDRPTVGCALLAILGVAVMFPAAIHFLSGEKPAASA